jgi:hypothetical protein
VACSAKQSDNVPYQGPSPARVQAEILHEITALNRSVANTAPTMTAESTAPAR